MRHTIMASISSSILSAARSWAKAWMKTVPAALCIALVSTQAMGQCQTWTPFVSDTGVNGLGGSGIHRVRTLSVFNGDLIAGGNFTDAGGQSVNHIARWDGTVWHPLANGLSSDAYAMTEFNSDLIVGGNFTNGIARWNGSNWLPFGETQSLRSLFVFNGELYAGGQFFTVDGEDMPAIARLDGDSVWQSVGVGVTLSSGPLPYVASMADYNGDLIVGGHFIEMGHQLVRNIARWDGATWHAMGEGTGSGNIAPVNALVVHNGKVFAGGEFTTMDGQSITNIARWDGSSWEPLGSGVNGPVFDMTVHNGELIVGGDFNSAGGTSVANIARWDDVSETWQPLDVGVNSDVLALTVYGFDVIAGGRFITAGGNEARLIARYAGDGPEIAQQPQNMLVPEGQDTTMSVVVANPADGPYTYQWRKDGVDLADGTFISGATEPTLMITSTSATDFGVYDVRITSACGSIFSSSVAVAITAATGTCPDLIFGDDFKASP
jgi:hypothetical protein